MEPRIYTASDVAKIATDFFYYWYNAKGTNTMQGFSDWWKENENVYKFAHPACFGTIHTRVCREVCYVRIACEMEFKKMSNDDTRHIPKAF